MGDRIELDLSFVLRPAEGVAWVAVGNEVVVHRVAPSASFVLNDVAGLVWRCLDGASSMAEILADVADVFATPLARIEADFGPIVSGWLDQRLVEEVRDE